MIDIFTSAGFNRPTYDNLLKEQILRAKKLFGDDIETDEKSVLGKFIRLNVYDLAIAYEILEGVYYSNFPDTANGVSLDRLCVFKGIHRNSATYAKHRLTVSATQGTALSENFKFSTESGIEFVTHESVTLSESTEIIVYAAEEGSIGNVPNGAITRIVNPENGISGISNSVLLEAGADAESDYLLRQRFNSATSQSGSGTADSIRSAILSIAGVRGCQVTENTENNTFTCYVSAPSEKADEIAQAIFDKKPVGILSVGDESTFGTAYDDNGGTHTINYISVRDTPVYISVSVRVSSLFPTDGNERIKNNLISKISLLGIDDDIILSSLYSCIYSVSGVEEVTDLRIGTSADNLKNENIAIARSQIATVVDGNIEVVTT